MIRAQAVERRRRSLADALVLAGTVTGLLALGHVARQMTLPAPQGAVSLDPAALPLYAAESVLRMLAAFVLSLAFSVTYAYAAVRSPVLERILLPVLDILQSVPVLGFLSATLGVFLALIPSTRLALEMASVFAIFTSQAWNITYALYHSLTTLPRDLEEAARMLRLPPLQRMLRFELPYAAIPLVWNAMMSFGGSWFFLAASEAITVLGHRVALPGLGSYMATAAMRGDVAAQLRAILAMAAVILLLDQVLWRPLLAWADRFKMETSGGLEPPSSWLLTLLRRSYVWEWVAERLLVPAVDALERLGRAPGEQARPSPVWRGVGLALLGVAGAGVLARGAVLAWGVVEDLGARGMATAVSLGAQTLLRVAAATGLGLLLMVPLGVLVGQHPRVRQAAQPVIQFLASFPANMLFPFVVTWYLRAGISLDVGAVPLMLLGTQWYILFNVVAGTTAVPRDLWEAARVMRLGVVHRWRHVVLPAIYPSLVTGALTAAGGAWNASIVAEIVEARGHTLVAQGLGAYITEATARGDWPAITAGLVVMSLLVLTVNALVWRPLERLAVARYRLD